MPRAQSRKRHVTEAANLRMEVNGPPKPRTAVASDLRQEPDAGKPHAGICAGGGGGRQEVNPVPTATSVAGCTPTRYLSAQKVDASIACKVINRMTSLGMPVSRKVA